MNNNKRTTTTNSNQPKTEAQQIKKQNKKYKNPPHKSALNYVELKPNKNRFFTVTKGMLLNSLYKFH